MSKALSALQNIITMKRYHRTGRKKIASPAKNLAGTCLGNGPKPVSPSFMN
jgi:hypothetical protein